MAAPQDDRTFNAVIDAYYLPFWTDRVGRPVTMDEARPLIDAFVANAGPEWWHEARSSQGAFKNHMRELAEAVLEGLKP